MAAVARLNLGPAQVVTGGADGEEGDGGEDDEDNPFKDGQTPGFARTTRCAFGPPNAAPCQRRAHPRPTHTPIAAPPRPGPHAYLG